MSIIGEILGLSRPDPPEPTPVPEPPDLEKIEREQRSRAAANTGIQSRIFTSPLGVSQESSGKKLLGE